jgi:hypothetical protein
VVGVAQPGAGRGGEVSALLSVGDRRRSGDGGRGSRGVVGSSTAGVPLPGEPGTAGLPASAIFAAADFTASLIGSMLETP